MSKNNDVAGFIIGAIALVAGAYAVKKLTENKNQVAHCNTCGHQHRQSDPHIAPFLI